MEAGGLGPPGVIHLPLKARLLQTIKPHLNYRRSVRSVMMMSEETRLHLETEVKVSHRSPPPAAAGSTGASQFFVLLCVSERLNIMNLSRRLT